MGRRGSGDVCLLMLLGVSSVVFYEVAKAINIKGGSVKPLVTDFMEYNIF